MSIEATHKGCGGEIKEDPSIQYEYEGTSYPAVRCNKCNKEILGDAEIELHMEIEVPR